MSNSLVSSLMENRPSKDDRRILNFQFNGYVIMLGKNSFSNERMITEHPHKECLWMHALAARGSHLILCIHQHPEPPEAVIQFAAKLALSNSQSEARSVSVSLLRDVFKPDNAGIGIWKTSKSLTVEVAE